MGYKSKIEWTDHTHNPWQGCHKVSTGCLNCYMEREKKRYGADPNIVVRSSDKLWREAYKWNKVAAEKGIIETVFVCSWSDFLIEEADQWRDEYWQIIRACQNLRSILLTKREDRIVECLPPDWGEGYPNVCLAVTAENQAMADKRIPVLLSIPARWRMVSIEPMLGPIDLLQIPRPERFHQSPHGWGSWLAKELHWVVLGSESGPNRRPSDISWIQGTVNQCREMIPVFVKQCEINGKLSKDPQEWPEVLKVQARPW